MFSTLCTETLLLKAWDSVKSKNAGGGVDGLNVSDFDAGIGKNIRELSEDLKAGQWEPQPYLRIEIPKKENEKRKLGLLTIRDKIVQQGIRLLIEPKCENLFLGNNHFLPTSTCTHSTSSSRLAHKHMSDMLMILSSSPDQRKKPKDSMLNQRHTSRSV